MKWHNRFMNLAKEVSTWSKDHSTQVGAIYIGDKKQILSTGFNGFPKKIIDSEERLNNRELKYKYTIHAELNGIYNAVYNGINLNNSTLYVYGLPVCSACALAIIQVGVKTIVIQESNINKSQKWQDSWHESLELLKESNVEVLII